MPERGNVIGDCKEILVIRRVVLWHWPCKSPTGDNIRGIGCWKVEPGMDRVVIPWDITMLLLPVADEGNGIVERLLAWVSLKNKVGTPHV